MITLQTLLKENIDVSLADLKTKSYANAVKDIQKKLKECLLLEKIDGQFGLKSYVALENFAKLTKIKLLSGVELKSKLTSQNPIAEDDIESAFNITVLKVLDKASFNTYIPGYYLSNNKPHCNGLLIYFLLHDWFLETGKGEINLVSITGMNRNGTLTKDTPFRFNDRLIHFTFDEFQGLKVPKLIHNFLSTAQPGRHYWLNPMNPKGCAVLEPKKQWKAWSVGIHRNYNALIQTGSVCVLRGNNKIKDSGYFGINIHSVNKGQDFNFGDEISRYSAGCSVLASRREFDEIFMKAIYSSSQYRANKNYKFYYAVIDGENFRYTAPFMDSFSF